MKFNLSRYSGIPLLTVSLLVCIHSFAQVKSPDDSRYRLQLRNGSFIPEKNITETRLAAFNSSTGKVRGSLFTIIQFESIPTTEQKQLLKQSGIELLDYVPNNAYTATVRTNLTATLLNQVKARAVITLAPEQKMQPSLA